MAESAMPLDKTHSLLGTCSCHQGFREWSDKLRDVAVLSNKAISELLDGEPRPDATVSAMGPLNGITPTLNCIRS